MYFNISDKIKHMLGNSVKRLSERTVSVRVYQVGQLSERSHRMQKVTVSTPGLDTFSRMQIFNPLDFIITHFNFSKNNIV